LGASERTDAQFGIQVGSDHGAKDEPVNAALPGLIEAELRCWIRRAALVVSLEAWKLDPSCKFRMHGWLAGSAGCSYRVRV
jgi:hypothetical protein